MALLVIAARPTRAVLIATRLHRRAPGEVTRHLSRQFQVPFTCLHFTLSISISEMFTLPGVSGARLQPARPLAR
jgi:hypothetical protein